MDSTKPPKRNDHNDNNIEGEGGRERETFRWLISRWLRQEGLRHGLMRLMCVVPCIDGSPWHIVSNQSSSGMTKLTPRNRRRRCKGGS